MAWFGPAGREIHYQSAGYGEPVLLLPGWGGSIVEFGGLRGELANGFRVIAADLPGSGRSQPQPRDYPATFYRDDAYTFLALLDALQIDAAHLAGFSDGGEVALLMAQLSPRRARSVVTWGACGSVTSTPEELALVARLVDDPPEPMLALAAYLVEAYSVGSARAMAASWARALGTIVESGGSISRDGADAATCPILLITGTYDPFCSPDTVREMAEALPRGVYVEAADAGHAVHVSHPGWLTDTVSAWLAGH